MSVDALQRAQALDRQLTGEVVGPDHPGYPAQRRVWNGSIDRYPALIARCRSEDDVVTAVRFGREEGLLTAVRAGGHSFPGLSVCDDGLVVDLSLMKRVRVDPDRGTVRAQAGLLLGELDRATQQVGAAVPAGIVSHTGLAGLTLGGGLGWLQRQHGLTVDSLLSARLVTVDGDVVTASEKENPDLFWGLRGGGGNFGVVTEFELRTHSVGPVLGGPIFWPMSAAGEVLRFYREWVTECPDELMTIVVQRRLPDLPAVPPHVVGERALGVVVCWSGPVEQGERCVEPLRLHGSPLVDALEAKSYVEHQQTFDPSFPHGCWYYVQACDIAALDDDVIAVMAEKGAAIDSPMSSVALWQMGGAVARVGDDETAFAGRQAGFTFNINGNSSSAAGFAAERRWARSYWDALAPHHLGTYVNFLMDEGVDRVRAAYGERKYDRLARLKREYDPDNFFRLNQNVRPALDPEHPDRQEPPSPVRAR